MSYIRDFSKKIQFRRIVLFLAIASFVLFYFTFDHGIYADLEGFATDKVVFKESKYLVHNSSDNISISIFGFPGDSNKGIVSSGISFSPECANENLIIDIPF